MVINSKHLLMATLVTMSETDTYNLHAVEAPSAKQLWKRKLWTEQI